MGLGISGSVAVFALWLQGSRACVASVMRHGGMHLALPRSLTFGLSS